MQTALDHLFFIGDHVVAQVIETIFVVGPVCDVACIGAAALVVVQTMHDQADGQS